MKKLILPAIPLLLSILSPLAHPGEITDTYADGDILTESLLNNAKAAVNDNDQRITVNASDIATLVAEVADLQARIVEFETSAQVTALQARVVELETKLANVSNETVNGQPTLRFSGINVQIVNGLNSTNTANGTGNLLVGYDEENLQPGTERCSLGTDPNLMLTVSNEFDCISIGATWGLSHKTGSHNVVVGPEHNYTRWGNFVSGYRNTVNYEHAAILGGSQNTAQGSYSAIVGGRNNRADAIATGMGGGNGAFGSSTDGWQSP